MLGLNCPDSKAVENEIRAATKLCNGSHKHIITILRHGEFSDLPYVFIDMELCFCSLDEYNKSHWILAHFDGCSNESRIWDIMMQIACGLKFVHEMKEIHRDLKPRNGNSYDEIN